MSSQPKSAFSAAINAVEETLIAAILGAMTLLTFANGVVRYAFNSTILSAPGAPTMA